MKKSRRNFSSEEKVAILRRHFVEKVPVSDLCDEYSFHPTQFYRWQKAFFGHGAAAFDRQIKTQEQKFGRKITALEKSFPRRMK